MIQIDDDDMPIDVAKKIITGQRPNTFMTDIFGENIDMFKLEEIKEIGLYLLVFYNSHYMSEEGKNE